MSHKLLPYITALSDLPPSEALVEFFRVKGSWLSHSDYSESSILCTHTHSLGRAGKEIAALEHRG